MQLGMVGLGRMGGNMVRRLMRDGHECVVYDRSPEAVQTLADEGATGAASLADLVAKLDAPRAVWIMVPAGVPTDTTVRELAGLMSPGDTVIDGGNSYYRDDIDRASALADTGVHFIDVGTSGGVWGLERGYCLMIGGDAEPVARLNPIFESIAPGFDTAERTPGRSGELTQAERGYLHCGPHGAGHFVKMVHNGIEYGLMAAYAEGLNILVQADVGTATRQADAETAPLNNPQYYQFGFDIGEITELWRRGSVVTSWLLDLTAQALVQSPQLEEFSGRVSDSGEGRWTALAAVEEGVPAPTLTAALYSRFASRDLDQYANQVLSAMRKGFGGHAEQPPVKE